jgi:hypothetical protein
MKNPCRDTCNCNSRGENAFDNYCAGPDPNSVSDMDPTQDLCSLANVHVVPDKGGIIGVAAIAADATVAVYYAILPDAGLGIDNNGTIVLKLKPLVKASGTDNESETGA